MKEIEDILIAYLAGEELSSEEQNTLEEWMRNSSNTKLVSVLGRMRGGDRVRKQLQADPKRGMQSIVRRIRVKAKRDRLRRLYIYSASACLLLLLSTTFFYWGDFGLKQGADPIRDMELVASKSFAHLELADGRVVPLYADRNEVIVADSFFRVENKNNTLVYDKSVAGEKIIYNTITVPLGAEFNVLLADGTKVYLNAGSELRFPVAFAGDTRDVYLEGEGYFEVARDTTKRFRVHTTDMMAVVLGTSFNVKSYADQENVATTLEEGHLKVICLQREYDLRPGYQVRYDKSTRESELVKVNTSYYSSWKDGYYWFNEMSLVEVMEILSKWYDLDVRYLDDEVKKYEFSGRLKRYDDVTYLLDKFEETGGIEFIVDKNVITVKKK